jgi:hypothetical protein
MKRLDWSSPCITDACGKLRSIMDKEDFMFNVFLQYLTKCVCSLDLSLSDRVSGSSVSPLVMFAKV